MSVLIDTAAPRSRRNAPRRSAGRRGVPTEPPPLPVMAPWVASQSLNSIRHSAALRPFRRDEFGTQPSAPSPGHLQAANALIVTLRQELMRLNVPLRDASQAAL